MYWMHLIASVRTVKVMEDLNSVLPPTAKVSWGHLNLICQELEITDINLANYLAGPSMLEFVNVELWWNSTVAIIIHYFVKVQIHQIKDNQVNISLEGVEFNGID